MRIRYKKSVLFTLALLFIGLSTVNLKAQDITNWYGELNVSSTTLPITLKIEKKADTTIILMGSPAQTDRMFGVTKQRVTKDSIIFSIKNMGVVYRGKYNETEDTIKGLFKQGVMLQDLSLGKTKDVYELKRPQEPKPPYPYFEQELGFKVKGVDYDFKGTLTLPSRGGVYPCVILITGSGMENRDEEVFGHKPFKVIADYLTRNGIAVFRYDDRGWAAKTVDPKIIDATTLDFANDAQAAFDMLKTNPNIDSKRIGMLGHSEGGPIVSICASKNSDIKFIILLAGSGMKGIDVLLQQNEVIFKKDKAPQYLIDVQLAALREAYKLIKKDLSNEEIKKRMNKWFDAESKKHSMEEWKNIQFSSDASRIQFISFLTTNWAKTFLKLDPSDYLKKVKQPVFALNGTKDVQVLYQYNLPAIENAMKQAKNEHFSEYKAEGMNHLFQECKTCTVDEYSKIEQTISPIILEKLRDFIKENTK